jgi:hypothetical protein
MTNLLAKSKDIGKQKEFEQVAMVHADAGTFCATTPTTPHGKKTTAPGSSKSSNRSFPGIRIAPLPPNGPSSYWPPGDSSGI